MSMTRPHSRTLLLLCLLLGSAAGCSSPPKGPTQILPLKSVGIAVPEGQLMVFNEPETYFTFLLQGDTIRNTPDGVDPFILIVDSLPVQMTSLPITDFFAGDVTEFDDVELLTMHQSYEVKYLRDRSGADFGIYREHLTTADGRGFLMWTMDAKDLPTHIIVSTVLRPRILLLSATLRPGFEGDGKRAMDILIGAMQTVRRRTDRIDLKKLRDSVSKAGTMVVPGR